MGRRQMNQVGEPRGGGRLTRSEQRVLELLSHGYTNREIAGTLVCSGENVGEKITRHG